MYSNVCIIFELLKPRAFKWIPASYVFMHILTTYKIFVYIWTSMFLKEALGGNFFFMTTQSCASKLIWCIACCWHLFRILSVIPCLFGGYGNIHHEGLHTPRSHTPLLYANKLSCNLSQRCLSVTKQCSVCDVITSAATWMMSEWYCDFMTIFAAFVTS